MNQQIFDIEAQLAQAVANGYERDAHADADQIIEARTYVAKTMRNQERTLNRYLNWAFGREKDTSSKTDTQPLNMDQVRFKYLGKAVPAPTLQHVKDFVRYYVATSKPVLDDDKPTIDSIKTIMEFFFAGFTRHTGTKISKDFRSEVYYWVSHTLKDQGLVVRKHYKKYNFDKSDLERLLVALWRQDDLTFIPERHRVQFTFIVHVYCWTGARIGAFFNGSLTYRDVQLVLQRVDDQKWRLIYRLDQRWVKNNRDPEHVVFSAAARDDEELIYNEAAFLLTMAVADKALYGFSNLDEVRDMQIPEGKTELPLRFHDAFLDRPILRKVTKQNGIGEGPMSEDAFKNILSSTLKSVGYNCRLTIHYIRRALGKRVDERYTPVQRAQHLTQGDTRVFGQSYVANCSSVDGQAAFRGKHSDHRHIEYFQGIGQFREEGLPYKLPARQAEELNGDQRLVQIRNEIQHLSLTDNPEELKRAKQRLVNERCRLTREQLKLFRTEWVRSRRDRMVMTRGREKIVKKSNTEIAQVISAIIPERSRLGEWMEPGSALAADEMWAALRDIHSLCTQDFTVAYLPGMSPTEGRCPAEHCKEDMTLFTRNTRQRHIHLCLLKDLAKRHACLQSDVHYCYLCYQWQIGSEWDSHCRGHLAELASKRCGSVSYTYSLIRPGYCPFCLGDSSLPAASKLRPWTRDHHLWQHVNDAHIGDRAWPSKCPHPLCKGGESFEDESSLVYHLIDDHDMRRTRPQPGANRKRKAPSEDLVSWTTPNVGFQPCPEKKVSEEDFWNEVRSMAETKDDDVVCLSSATNYELGTALNSSPTIKEDCFSEFIQWPSLEPHDGDSSTEKKSESSLVLEQNAKKDTELMLKVTHTRFVSKRKRLNREKQQSNGMSTNDVVCKNQETSRLILRIRKGKRGKWSFVT